MSDQKEPDNKFDPDLYLKSPKAFHLEMPLYHTFDLSVGAHSEKIFDSLIFNGTIDAYCTFCDKESVFRANEYYMNMPTYRLWHEREQGFTKIVYVCTRNTKHDYSIYYLKILDPVFEGRFLKIGQWPSTADFQIPQAAKYRKILGEEQYKEFTRGAGLAAHGVGIGSFIYMRRIFENLVEEAHTKTLMGNPGFPNDVYRDARMDEKIKMVREHLPEFLVENRSLYAILSKGVHDLTEKECLRYFEAVKVGIEQILDEKIIQKERFEKATKAREAIQEAHGHIVSTT